MASIKIKLDDGKEFEFDIYPTCQDCKEALEQLVVEFYRPPRELKSNTDRIPIILLRDPDYVSIMHLEKLPFTIQELRSKLAHNELLF